MSVSPAHPAATASRRRLLCSATALAVAAGTVLAAGAASAAAAPPDLAPLTTAGAKAIPGSYVVVLDDGADGAAVARRNGVRPKFVYSAALEGFSANLTKAQLRKVRAHPSVKYVAEDAVARINAKPAPPAKDRPATKGPSNTSTQTGATWGIDRVDQRTGLNGTYNYTMDGNGVRVYVLDTGILTSHSQFQGRADVGFDAVRDGRNGQDCHGHGTHVAGTVGGATFGVAKRAALTSVRVLGCNGSGSFSGVIAGIDWVTYTHDGPSVANMSLGGSLYRPVNDAVTRSIAHGVTYAVAAGNENRTACAGSPASTPAATTVGATTMTAGRDVRAAFSNFGPCVDVFAPGQNITSAWIGSTTATRTISGTSMAAPHVAGLSALYLQANPHASPRLVEEVLKADSVRNVVVNAGPGSPNAVARRLNGVVTAGGSAYQPDGAHWRQVNPGYIQGWLRGTPGTDPDLYLQRWNGSSWVTVAGSASLTPNERIVYNGPSGYYRFRTYGFAGSGSFDLFTNHPA